uniref:Glycerophosphodiester phosphodiesterase n=1 Tax=Prevotella sp. GTC17262 TaxID=3236797 RepID=A0AB33JQC8_9BACT
METKLRHLIVVALLTIPTLVLAGHKVIAHRGHWKVEGAAQNSRASLQNALALQIYGSETDIWLTADGRLMVNHDPAFKGVTLQTATYKECRQLMLDNGERMPQLRDLLKMLKKSKSPTKLIIEIKPHATPERNRVAAQKTLGEVARYGLADRVEYISFSLDVCRELIRLDRHAKVAYLNGELSPDELHRLHFTGLDYHYGTLRQHPEWIRRAHELGLTVNVWTVDKPADIKAMSDAGVDFITTNNPTEAMK